MKKILIYARDPGSVNVVIPLIQPLKQKGYKVLIYAKDVAITRFKANNIEARDILSEISKANKGNINSFLIKHQPNFVITGTSADDMTEKYIWKASEYLGIPTFAILDQWINYGIRFSKYAVSSAEQYQGDKKIDYLPTKILVMDQVARREAIQEGLPEDRILITGQPYFEYIRNKEFSEEQIRIQKTKLGIEANDRVVLFASEPIICTYGGEKKANLYWGYDEIKIFNYLYSVLLSLKDVPQRKIKLIIKVHPKEYETYYQRLISNLKNDKIKLILNKNSDPQELIRISDLVCGMSSMLLLESFILSKPTISIQIGLKRENPFILDRLNILKSILSVEQLEREINQFFQKPNKNRTFKLIGNPIEKVINQMEKILCQS